MFLHAIGLNGVDATDKMGARLSRFCLTDSFDV